MMFDDFKLSMIYQKRMNSVMVQVVWFLLMVYEESQANMV